MRRFVPLGAAIALILVVRPSNVEADPDLTSLVAAAYFPRTETLHDLAHQRAEYQVAFSGGVCAENSLTHDGWSTAEVLACNYTGPARAVEQWQGSPAHHAILSDPTLNTVGCAAAAGVDGAIFYACVLATTDPPAPAPPPAPTAPPPPAGTGTATTPTPAPALPDTRMP